MNFTRLLSLAGTAVVVASCDPFGSEPMADYEVLQTLYDQKTGLYVEVGSVENFSSFGYNVYVFNVGGPRGKFDKNWNPVISTAGTGSNKPTLIYDGNCYILTIEYRYGGLIHNHWNDLISNKSLCFDLRPDRGPKGGFHP